MNIRSWTIDEILKNAQEALLNITRIPLPQGGRRTLIGKSNNGVSIKFLFDQYGKIISFYPNI